MNFYGSFSDTPTEDQYLLTTKQISDPTLKKLTIIPHNNFTIPLETIIILSKNITITYLYIGNCNIGPQNTKHLSKNTTITTLHISYNNLGPKGAKYLSKNTTIRLLDISGNNIGSKGASYLTKNTTIQYLDISSNNICSKGIYEISKNTTIKILNICYNEITDEGVIYLARNKYIKQLFVDRYDSGVYTIFFSNYAIENLVGIWIDSFLRNLLSCRNKINKHNRLIKKMKLLI